MNCLKITFVIIALGFSSSLYSQCAVTAYANPTEICAGQTASLWAQGGCGILMYNDFNNATPGAGWVATTGVNFTNPCGPGPDAIYLWMGNQVPIPRTLTTVPFNVSTACTITFWLRFEVQTGNPSTCEGPDLADEGVSLQYSINNGATWTDMVYFRPDGQMVPSYPNSSGFSSPSGATPFTTWAQYSFPVPAAAASPATMFRWRQHSYSGQDYDHWGLDVVEIICPGSSEVIWSHGPTVLNPPDVSPTQTTTYIVTVIDTINGLSATDSVTIIVNPGPTAQFTATSVCEGEQTIFTDQSTPMSYPISSWNWSFGDGNTSTQQNPTYQYSGPGSYNVTLSIEDTYGCADAITKQVNVYAAPQIQFSGQPLSGCAPLTVSFQDQSTVSGGGSIVSRLWNFGNGTTSIAANPSCTYQAGTYNVSLTASTAQGCESSLTVPGYVQVYPNPIAAFSYAPSENYMLSDINFFDQSSGATQWLWNFGNGQTSNVQNPVFVYNNSGNYTVTLYVENTYGCSDETEMKIVIQSNDIIYFPNAFTPNGDGINDHFMPYGIFWSSDGYNLKIFNRYGEIIYHTNDMNNPWDGTHMRTGKIVPPGVYPFKLFIRALNGKEYKYEGFVTVIP